MITHPKRFLRSIVCVPTALALFLAGPTVASSPQQKALAPFTETLPNSVVKIEMVPVPAGTITIGGKDVAIKPFWIAKTETPWEAFDLFLSSGDPSPPYDQTEFPADAVARPSKTYILPDLGWGHNGYPAINLSFTTVEMYCRWLSKETGKKYRVPTEAEWEFAARAGLTGDWAIDPAARDEAAWHKGNSRGVTHPVGKKTPNAWGLHDMLGNVGEWATDLEGKPVLCGGAYSDKPEEISPTQRRRWTPKWQEHDPQLPKSRWWLSNGPFVGFRLVCEG